MAFPAEWAERWHPLPGHILVQREESPEQTSAGLWIPTRYRESVKTPVALVVRSGDQRISAGDFVLVAEGAGRRIAFGDFKPTVYYDITYEQCRMRFARVVKQDNVFEFREVSQQESTYRQHLPEDILLIREDVVDQGLSTAIGSDRGNPR